MIIDIHTHAFPDQLAPKAMQSLAQKASIPYYFNGTVAGLKDSMRRAGVTHSVLCNIAVKPAQTESIFQFALDLLEREGKEDFTVIPFASIHPFDPDWRTWLQRIKNAGFLGVKLHPEYQQFYIDDPCLEPVYKELKRLNLRVLFHAGQDDGVPPPVHATPRRIANVLPLLEDCQAILAHMGSCHMEQEVLRYLCGRNIYFDTSYQFSRLDQDIAKKIFLHHGPERILFGTDAPWEDQKSELNYMCVHFAPGFLSDTDLDRVLWRNAAALLQLEVKG